MYESWFGLNERPFRMVPNAERFFESGDIQNAYELIVGCVQSGAGPALIVGPTGVGKTTLSLRIKEHFDREITAAMVSGPTCYSRRAVLQNSLTQFGMPFSNAEDNELRTNLQEYFNSRSKGCVLIMDDAGMLNDEAFEELRFLSNLTYNGRWCVHLVLLGNMRLEERMTTPVNESLNQRIATRCYLGPWTRDETGSFIDYELSAAGYEGDHLFEPSAIAKIHEISSGTPRVINQLSNHSLTICATQQERSIDDHAVEFAWADLQKLPTPSRPNRVGDPDIDIVEFGSLDDAEPAAPAESNETAPTEQVADPTPSPSPEFEPEDAFAAKFAPEFGPISAPVAEETSIAFLAEESTSECNNESEFEAGCESGIPAEITTSQQSASEEAPCEFEEHTALDAVDNMVSSAAQAEIAANIGTSAQSADTTHDAHDSTNTESPLEWSEKTRLDADANIDNAKAVAMAAVAAGVTSTPIAANLIKGKPDEAKFSEFAAHDPEVAAENRAASNAQIGAEPTNDSSDEDISAIEQTIVELQDETRDLAAPEAEAQPEPRPEPVAAVNPFLEQFDEEEVVFGRPEGLQHHADVIASEVNTASGQDIIQRLADADHEASAEPEEVCEEACEVADHPVDCVDEHEDGEYTLAEFSDQPQDAFQSEEDESPEDQSSQFMSFGDLPFDPPADQPLVESHEEQSCQEVDSCNEQSDESQCEADESQCEVDESYCDADESQCEADESQCPDESSCETDESSPAVCDSESDCEHEAAEYDSGAQGIVICGGEPPSQLSGEQAPYEVVATLGVARSESGAAQPEAADPVENPYLTDNSYTDAAQTSGKPKRQRFSRLFSGMRKKNQ